MSTGRIILLTIIGIIAVSMVFSFILKIVYKDEIAAEAQRKQEYLIAQQQNKK